MPILVERSLFKIGGGFAVTLPKAWVRNNNLKPGDKVEVIANREVIVRLKGEREKENSCLYLTNN